MREKTSEAKKHKKCSLHTSVVVDDAVTSEAAQLVTEDTELTDMTSTNADTSTVAMDDTAAGAEELMLGFASQLTKTTFSGTTEKPHSSPHTCILQLSTCI